MKILRQPLASAGFAMVAAAAVTGSFTGAASASPALQATGGSGAPYGAFTTSATATPLRVELYEPAIPIPASPQLEFNFSYTNVTGSSGPDSTAAASAMWPGGAIGTGLPAIFANVGLPEDLLGKGGYPVQVNAQYPGQPNSASQEFLPGMVGRVSGSSTQAIARAGYSTSGQVAGDPASGNGASSLLSQLQSGNLGALGSLLNGPNSGSNTGSNPLGLLSAVVSVGGMSSSSVTNYGDPSTVNATATSQVGTIQLLGGLVTLEGFTASSTSSSSLGGGGKATQKVTYGGLTIQGHAFKITSNGIEAAGQSTATPDTSATTALAKLGLSLTIPKPTQKTTGTQVTAAAAGPTITIDTTPIISMLKLDKLPLSGLLNQLPSSANQLKGLLLAALQAHPKIVVLLGDVSSSAQTLPSLGLGGGASGSSSGGVAPPSTNTGLPGSTGVTGVPGGTGVAGTTASGGSTPSQGATPIKSVSAPGLPPMGSLPSLLILGGLVIASGLGWFFRAAALNALGAGSTCTHGLATGLPDLRKA